MLNLLTRKNKFEANFKPKELDVLLAKIAQIYRIDDIDADRKKYLSKTMRKYGYLPYPQFKVLQELTPAETIYCLVEKLVYAKTFDVNKFIDFQNPSVLARKNIKNSNWFKKEHHNIKLLSLSGLGDGNSSESTGHFLDWINCLITLSSGNEEFGILPTTIYLIPFFKREFDCAYLPKSSEVSPKLQDDNLMKFLGLDANAQVKLFIELAQLCNHPVIYDILPQTARFSKIVLANPYVARWVDINELSMSISGYLNALCAQLIHTKQFPEKDVLAVQKAYLENLKGNCKKYSSKEQKIVDVIEEDIKEYKILATYKMSFKDKQEELLKKAEEIIVRINKKHPRCEEDIVAQDEITAELIKQGLWTLPGGAWCSAGVPVFDKMSKNREYPIFKHYNYKGEDVTHFANLDCQTPYFFYYFELNKYNEDVVDFYMEYTQKLQKEFNFDGFRVDHIDHIVDEVSQDKKGQVLSYRIPAKVLGKVNANLKKKIPYFATLAEYMLWDGYFKEYHKDMKFDLLWGDDIVAQSIKTPEQIVNDNLRLSTYNQKQAKTNPLAILKGYNNQDGEFRDINQYPGQLGFEGALFKWFKMKFIPGGKFAQRPTLLVDGDESFTKVGIERVISKEVSMVRNYDWDFFEKFNALDYFAQHDKLLNQGRAVLHNQENNGFVCWEVVADSEVKAKKGEKQPTYLIVANYLAPHEIKDVQYEDGRIEKKNVRGTITKNNTVKLKRGKKLVSYFEFQLDEMNKCMFVEKPLENDISKEITFKELRPGEFRVYKMI
ncbi:MAG: hypothetical protein IJD57_03185 [Candidatus Gastranaerophilales bacterium]|nr:hypothetical protein [Candidatus Gastranaerophilales bacterium]